MSLKITFRQSQLSTSIPRNVTRVRTYSIKNNFSNRTKTYTVHVRWELTRYITPTRLFILIVSKSICEKIAFEERLKSYGLRFTFVSFQVLIAPAPIGGRKERGGVGKGKKWKYWEGGYPRMAGKKLLLVGKVIKLPWNSYLDRTVVARRIIDLGKQRCDLRAIDGRKHKGSIKSFPLHEKYSFRFLCEVFHFWWTHENLRLINAPDRF